MAKELRHISRNLDAWERPDESDDAQRRAGKITAREMVKGARASIGGTGQAAWERADKAKKDKFVATHALYSSRNLAARKVEATTLPQIPQTAR